MRRVRRQRISLRVKLKRRHGRRGFSVAAVLAVAVGLAFAASRADVRRWGGGLRAKGLAYRSVVLEGLPEAERSRLAREAVELGAENAFVERVSREAPALRVVSVERSVWARRLTVRLAPRVPLARLADGRVLGKEGGLFKPAAEPGGLPLLESATADATGLADVLAALEKRGLPKAERLSRIGDGWRLTLADGTVIEWGGGARADAKAERLAEVLPDARKRFPKGVTADLRYFEDGKVLVRPAARGSGSSHG